MSINVGDGVTELLYTDRIAYTVTEVSSSGKTIFIQADKAILLNPDELEFIPGGFVATCINQSEQKYIYERDLDAKIKKATLRKDGFYRLSGCKTTGKLIEGRHHFYDYNF